MTNGSVDDKKYVLMEWADGWREITPVEADAVALRRYFVIERTEYFGRLVIDRPDGEVPGLIVTDRRPLDVTRAALVGVGACDLKKSSLYEEGGRVEHNYDLMGGAEDIAAIVAKEMRKALEEEGVTPAGVLAGSLEERREIVGRLAAGMKLVASKKQDDLIEFVEGMLRGLK